MSVRLNTKVIISVLLFCLCLSLIPQVYATTETRYMRGDQHTINGLTAYVLNTTQSDSQQAMSSFLSGSQDYVLKWGIRVWIRHDDNSETELTDGTWTQIEVSRSSNGEGLQSDTWDCPETNLATTDAIRVTVRENFETKTTNFITEQIGVTQLDSATWTFYLYTKRSSSAGFPPFILPSTSGNFYWGTDAKNSRIENFQYSTAPVGEWHNITTWNLDLNTRAWLSVSTWNFNLSARQWLGISTWIFNLTTRQWLNIAAWTFNLSTLQWNDITIWTFNLTTMAWQDIATWSFNMTTMAWNNIAEWSFQLMTRTWRNIVDWHFNLISLGWHTITYWTLTLTPDVFSRIVFFCIVTIIALAIGAVVVAKKRS